MGRNVYDEWNDDGTLPALKPCPFYGSAGVLNDNGYERPVTDMDTGAYIDMDIHEADGFLVRVSRVRGDTPWGGYAGRGNRTMEPTG